MNYDSSQIAVIEAREGYGLVLAPPGCGKTQILTERIAYAHKCGVEYSDMLCLTFTNRAARGMKERIMENVDDPDVRNVFVGNVHRYCSRFLFDNGLVPADSSVIDDDDVISILARFLNEDEDVLAAQHKRRSECFEAVHMAALMHQIRHKHPRELRVHPECVSKDDIAAFNDICWGLGLTFTPEFMEDTYLNTEFYRDAAQFARYHTSNHVIIMNLLRKLELAHFYEKYKHDNQLLDFEDLLLLTYDALVTDYEHKYKRYPWIQIDEVQDLNPLQLAILDKLSTIGDAGKGEILYLGDEQQAIFSFMGAKMSTLEQLKQRCKDNIFRLKVNHRSPKYLLDVFNEYAVNNLNIQPDLLPVTDYSPERIHNELMIMVSATQNGEYADAAQQAGRLMEQNEDDTTAIIVSSNADADMISNRLRGMNLPHFKVSGTDLFSMPELKLLFAHLAVQTNEHNFIAWARLLKGIGVYEQNAAARQFVRQLMDRGMLPSDLLLYDNSSYIMEFQRVYENNTIVVFDTETTGLNVREDDILQIAAVKMQKGEVLPGSEFTVYIRTDREIPAMLGDIENPIIEEMKHHDLLDHAEALQMFLDYAGDAVLLGHNADYDYHILRHNLNRYLPGNDFTERYPVYYDSLRLTRRLFPDLPQYKLKYLLEALHLEGENSHLADADVAATKNVVVACYRKSWEVVPLQQQFLALRSTKDRKEIFRRNYYGLYKNLRSRLWEEKKPVEKTLITDEIMSFYENLLDNGRIVEIEKLHFVIRYLNAELVDSEKERTLQEQISNHILEMSTLKESDLCGSGVVDDRIFVSTIHKAKGLEFDNVIVFDSNDDRYPGFFSQNNPRMIAEDARKFYVAITRAKKRLLIMMSDIKQNYRGQIFDRTITRFMRPILNHFATKRLEE